ncbi:hypothetical protein F2Q69_00035454 [Brassica cretica]|uniref:Uncharacterized protein n=1 Tax=Brassica cretica TaxID=69181 RepID=A0A8S9SPP0_BRACR|nr:hypothetical protein F2Q69_00035454 [Brassica cretica]
MEAQFCDVIFIKHQVKFLSCQNNLYTLSALSDSSTSPSSFPPQKRRRLSPLIDSSSAPKRAQHMSPCIPRAFRFFLTALQHNLTDGEGKDMNQVEAKEFVEEDMTSGIAEGTVTAAAEKKPGLRKPLFSVAGGNNSKTEPSCCMDPSAVAGLFKPVADSFFGEA